MTQDTIPPENLEPSKEEGLSQNPDFVIYAEWLDDLMELRSTDNQENALYTSYKDSQSIWVRYSPGLNQPAQVTFYEGVTPSGIQGGHTPPSIIIMPISGREAVTNYIQIYDGRFGSLKCPEAGETTKIIVQGKRDAGGKEELDEVTKKANEISINVLGPKFSLFGIPSKDGLPEDS